MGGSSTQKRHASKGGEAIVECFSPAKRAKQTATTNQNVGSEYVSPLRRVKTAIALEDNMRVIECVDELKRFITSLSPDEDVAKDEVKRIKLRLRLVWKTFENVATGPAVRLHLIDRRANEDLQDLYKGLRDDYQERKRIIDGELITASVYGPDAKKISEYPADGAIVCVRSLWKLTLFAGYACQFTTRLSALKIEESD